MAAYIVHFGKVRGSGLNLVSGSSFCSLNQRVGSGIHVKSNSGCRLMCALPSGKDPKSMTMDDWKQILAPEEYYVLREKGTERPGTGEYDKFYPEEGYFACRGCGNPLYSAQSKFNSGCGWPAMDKCYKNSVITESDMAFGMMRTEIMCAQCKGHLGHVFGGERFTETNERHCVNSLSIKYVADPLSEPLEEEKVLG
mmetsp:Transcript_1126/g.2107  ORF Transcript_1126/g.2107 Transcript_1126/m.2107 type:complete len:197 (-) Transcript_1126:230-820(-)|eukprot:CAMPEP_0182448824 /NCGR_PEP_ID=MMETSP1172-20130603/30092_1 /TAXON_ID=708627 /ORGANISM="Timspurckia oligopyrenoides, Strain CCMP3278" /LENGTH=196 /DNA_ID=CAMNT_0024645845 /DNA_START=63 /DNA_END=653 /DNA_ORIENTATION=+